MVLMIMPLAACSTPEGDFPSLSKRPYESADPVAEPNPVPVAVTTTMPAALSEQTNQLLVRNRNGDAAFAKARSAAESAARAGSGAAQGSESWVQGQMILSRLDAARSESVAALGEMDRMIAGERDKGADTGLIGLLDTVQAEIAASVANQEAVINRLSATIGR